MPWMADVGAWLLEACATPCPETWFILSSLLVTVWKKIREKVMLE